MSSTVTVYMKEAPEIKFEVHVRVTPAGDTAFSGSDGAPDFGALTGVAPAELETDLTLVYPILTYDGAEMLRAGYSSPSALELYQAALADAGFELTDSHSVVFGTITSYVYFNEETGVSIRYDEERLVNKIISITLTVY